MKEVVVTSGVLKQVLRFACEKLGEGPGGCLGSEVSGLLMGLEGKNDILIDAAVTGNQISKPFYTSLSDGFLAEVAKDISNGRMHGRILGWFHSHPGLGLFLSSIDVRSMRNMQRLNQNTVALVVDPLTEDKFRFYRYDFGQDRPYSLKARVIPHDP